MKKINDDPTEKAFRKRYARYFDLDDDLPEEPPNEMQAKKPLLRLEWLFKFPALTLGAWLIFKLTTASIDQLTFSPLSGVAPNPPEKSLLSLKIEPAPSGESIGSGDRKIGLRDDEAVSAADGGKIHKTPTAEVFLVVLLSTKSKDKAVESAKALSAQGHAGKVILSSTGYYGVVIGHSSYEQAKFTMKTIAAKNKPYIMTTGRVIKFVYP
jgi:hypothetical protein